jgi:glycosyltransferase involved in cell wall biosynthesis
LSRLSVSIIIATYNRAEWLPAAIDSLLQQTRPPDEIIVVDDGSTDDTQRVLATYAPSVTVITQANMGLSGARNSGIRAATGDLLAFLDSDDTLPPHSIDHRARVLEAHPEFGVVYGDALLIGSGGEALGKFTQFRPGPRPSGDIFAALAYHNLSPPHAYMIRRACLDKVGLFDESLTTLEDHDLWLRIAAHFQFYYVDEVVAHYQTHQNMMSLTRADAMRSNDILLQERAIQQTAFVRLTPRQQARIYTSLATKYAVEGEVTRARGWLQKSMRRSPGYLTAYSRFALTLLGKRGITITAVLVRKFKRRFRRITRWAYPSD